MGGDGGPGDDQGGGGRGQEQPGRQVHPVGEAVQPALHGPPGERPGDQARPEHRQGEAPEQQPHDVHGPRAHGLAHPDLLGAPLGGVGGQAQQAETGQEQGGDGQSRHQIALPDRAQVDLLHIVVEELAADGSGLARPLPQAVDGAEGLGDAAPLELDAHHLVGGIVEEVDHIDGGLHLGVQEIEGEVRDDARDREVAIARPHRHPAVQRLCRIGEAEPARRRHVDDDRAVLQDREVLQRQGIPWMAAVQQPPRQGADPVELEQPEVDEPEVGLHHGTAGRPRVHDELGGVETVEAEHGLRRAGRRPDPRKPAHLVLEGAAAGGGEHHQHLVLVELQPLVHGVARLAPDHRHGDDEPDQDGELEHHQHLAHRTGAGGLDLAALEHARRAEA